MAKGEKKENRTIESEKRMIHETDQGKPSSAK